MRMLLTEEPGSAVCQGNSTSRHAAALYPCRDSMSGRCETRRRVLSAGPVSVAQGVGFTRGPLRADSLAMAPQGRLDPLTQVEAYALASLFMVSLNETLWEAVAEPGPAQRGLWGPDGLCRAICAQLDVPERAWEVRGGRKCSDSDC